MSPEELKRLIASYTEEVWNKADVAAIDRFYSIDYVNHDASAPQVDTLADYKQWARGVLAGLSDFRVAINDIVVEDSMCVKRWTVTAQHSGTLVGVPATGKRVTYNGVTFYRIVGGKITESWWLYDLFNVLMQVGVIPTPRQA